MKRKNNWQDSIRYGLKNIKDINSFFNLDLPDIPYDILIPFNLALKIKEQGLNSPLAKQFIPSIEEFDDKGMYDPIGDQAHQKGGQLIHRYSNRVLFMPTKVCPVICRYCFRKNELSSQDDIFSPEFKITIDYLSKNEEINEIIFSGGDPFMLSSKKIDSYLKEFSKIDHIDFIRFHTRVPSSLPERINDELIEVLKKYKNRFLKITIVIHTNHKSELDDEVLKATKKLRPFQLLSQSVLLKDINDNEKDLFELFTTLIKMDITPYYLHHPDDAKGAMHFKVDIPKGRKIVATLRRKIPGWGLPQYILDIPGGHGKTPLLNPETIEFTGKVMNLNQELIEL